ncbi:MAG TPA: Smr/MutS family protein [Flavipsychrobacter sp.]|nr:Smr/MutS family protein [Flavipsychrobacter sp.]
MKFSIGDKVILKQTGEEGHVTAYISKDMVEVEVNGTTFPAYIEDIDHPYLKWFTEKKKVSKSNTLPEQLPVEKQNQRQQRLAKGFCISFLPVYKHSGMEDIVDVIKVHLLNELPVAVKFSYDLRLNHNSLFRHEGTIHAFGNVYLHSINWEDMTAQPRFHWQLTDTTNAQMQIAEGVLRIKPAKLFEQINELMLNNQPTFSYALIDDFAPKVTEKPKEKFMPTPKQEIVNVPQGPKTEPPKYELDLHIENLTDNTHGMDNADMLQLQLSTFERYLHLAILHRQERMIVIHGLGKGVLRDAIHEILANTPEVEHYVNEYIGKYGFGATEIFFRR